MAYPFGNVCGKCGARRIDAQLGLEATPDEWIAGMVAVFREVRRVLRDDATCWINCGDSFNAKQLLMMPARLALALQADGWWLRSDIIWHKPNPMPESVTDRPTSAHEHVFLLAKSARYYYDADAIREPSVSDHPSGNGYKREPRLSYADANGPRGNDAQWQMQPARNVRNVWTIPTEAFPEAHFATFPTELAERCIKAGTSERGCCAKCGAPWVRQTERGAAVPLTPSDAGRKATWTIGDAARDPDARTDTPLPRHYRPIVSENWAPSCQCEAPTQPATVLDPFAGAGTTGLVADRLQRNAIMIELSPAYCAMMRNRLVADAGMFAEVAD